MPVGKYYNLKLWRIEFIIKTFGDTSQSIIFSRFGIIGFANFGGRFAFSWEFKFCVTIEHSDCDVFSEFEYFSKVIKIEL